MPSVFSVGIEIRGLKELEDKLRQLPDKMAKRVYRQAMSKALTPLVKLMKQYVPKRTGALRRSLTKNVKTMGSRGMIIGSAGPARGKKIGGAMPSRYAHLVEFGTAPHWQEHLKRMHPGSAPRPFIRRAYQEAGPSISKIFIDQVRTKLDLIASGK